MRIPELARSAVLAVGRIPTKSAQRDLATLVLDDKTAPETRALAAGELNRNIQNQGIQLLRVQIEGLAASYQKAEEGPLKNNLALVFGSMKPGSIATGERLRQYQPAAPAAAPPPKEKEKE
jgi:hypothetical protein